MTTPFQPQAITAVAAQPPAYSLLIAADTKPESAEVAPLLGHGATWSPEQIGGGFALAASCRGDTTTKPEGTNPVAMTAEPFIIGTEDHCSIIGMNERDYAGRARRQMTAVQSFLIAREFQLGTQRDAGSLANYALTDATVLHPGGVSVLQAISMLEQKIGEVFHGRRGMIHLTPEALLRLAEGTNNALIKQGQRWVTPMGTIVAADAGYTTDKDGYVYAYATAPLQVLLGKEFTNPGSLEEAWNNGALDYTVNKVRIYVEKAAILLFDGGIATTAGSGQSDAMFKVQLNLTPPATHS